MVFRDFLHNEEKQKHLVSSSRKEAKRKRKNDSLAHRMSFVLCSGGQPALYPGFSGPRRAPLLMFLRTDSGAGCPDPPHKDVDGGARVEEDRRVSSSLSPSSLSIGN